MIRDYELHVISTGQQPKEKFIEIVSHIHMQVDFIHLRERNWTAMEYLSVIQKLHQHGVPLEKIIINDRADIAHVMNCGGIQLAHHSIDIHLIKNKYNQLRIGCSVHSVEEAVQKETFGANYLIYGHIFSTRSKPNMEPRGLECLSSITSSVTTPVIAIGGITPNNVKEVINAGASGVALLSGILLADDPLHAAQVYRSKLNHMKEELS